MQFQHNFEDGGDDDGTWTFDIATATWQHIAVVYDNGNVANNPIAYVNGAAVTATETQLPADNASSDAADFFIIGDKEDSSASWDGKIGEVWLYDSARSAAEMKSLYELTRWRYRV